MRSDAFRAEGALTIECQKSTIVPGFESVMVYTFMGLFGTENGVVANIEFGHKMVRSWQMYSIDEIRRGYARRGRCYRLKMKLL